MFRDRKRVFIDRMGWKLTPVAGEYEIDQFDTGDAVYLLDLASNGCLHNGSIRLLPSTKPHILGALFSELCDDDVPVGEDIWEISRLCMTPGLERGASRKIRDRLACAALEFGLLYGLTHYTLVSAKCWLIPFLHMGWHARMLGPVHQVNGEAVGALIVDVSPPSLRSLRSKTGVKNLLLKTGYLAQAA
jgi:N-acyl-L-homoserine lactone synthetase